jgi:hypothetical protein
MRSRNEARYYTFNEWSTAKWIIESNNQVTIQKRISYDFGYACNQLIDHDEATLNWAKDVLAYFDTYIKIAKIYCKHYLNSWGQSIKFLWSEIRKFKYYREINKLYSLVIARLHKIHKQSTFSSIAAIRKFRKDHGFTRPDGHGRVSRTNKINHNMRRYERSLNHVERIQL